MTKIVVIDHAGSRVEVHRVDDDTRAAAWFMGFNAAASIDVDAFVLGDEDIDPDIMASYFIDDPHGDLDK